MRRSGVTCAAFTVAVLVAGSAAAQDQVWLQDRRYSEGMGYRAGDLEFHPGLAAEFGYDSNYFLRSGGPGPVDSPIIPTLRLRITPSLTLSTLSEQRMIGGPGAEPPSVTFHAELAATYDEFIATQSKYQDQLSQQRNVGGSAGFGLTILPSRPISGDVYAQFLRTLQGSNNPDQNANRIQFRTGAGLTWAPGGGLFDWRFGYEYGLTVFEDSFFGDVYNSAYNQANTRGRWRFLPKTALLYDASLAFYRYAHPGAAQTFNVFDSDPVRARLGINGLITHAFGLLAMAGWGASFYEQIPGIDIPNFDGPIGQVELKWYITPNPSNDPQAATLALSSLAIGFTRDFVNSNITTYYTQNRGYLNFTHFFAGRLLTVIEGGVSALQYPSFTRFPSSPARQQIASFTDLSYDASLFAEYRFANAFGINTTVRYTQYSGDRPIPLSPDNPGLLDELSYKRFEAYLGVRWLM